MKINRFVLSEMRVNCYVVYDFDENRAILIDAPSGIAPVISFIKENSLALEAVLLTHAHFDHVQGLYELDHEFKDLDIYLSEDDEELFRSGNKKILKDFGMLSKETDKEFSCIEKIRTKRLPENIFGFDVIKTSGHTKGSVCFYSEKESILFSGDTLFLYGYGRYDLGGSMTELFASLKKIEALDGETMLLPGHGECGKLKMHLD